MNKIKFIQCSDVHLCMPFSSLQSKPGLPERRRGNIEDTFCAIIRKASEITADYLFVCGDLYEDKYAVKQVIDNINYEFKKIPSTKIILIPGNHDPDHIDSFYKTYKWNDNVHILSEENPVVVFEEDRTVIHNYNVFIDKGKTDTILIDNKYINIAMFHGTIDMVCTDDRYFPVSSEQLERHGFDYIATGHFHNKFLAYGKKRTIYNAGSPEPLGFDEEGEHGVILGEMEKDGPVFNLNVSEVPISKFYYRHLDIPVIPNMTYNQIVELIEEVVNELTNHDKMLVNVNITGSRNPEVLINVDRITQRLSKAVTFIKVIDKTKPFIDIQSVAKEPGIRGVFVRNILDKISGSPNEKEKLFYESVLYAGLDALSGNKPSINI